MKDDESKQGPEPLALQYESKILFDGRTMTKAECDTLRLAREMLGSNEPMLLDCLKAEVKRSEKLEAEVKRLKAEVRDLLDEAGLL